MSEQTANDSSLLSHCIPCKAKCCHDNLIVVTQIGHNKIIKAGHPDYFHRTLIPQGLFYVLDHQNMPDGMTSPHAASTPDDQPQPCPYLQNHQCSIEAVKPDSCASYPMVREIDPDGQTRGIGYSHDCPASRIAAKLAQFSQSSAHLIEKANQEMPVNLTSHVIKKHMAKYNR